MDMIWVCIWVCNGYGYDMDILFRKPQTFHFRLPDFPSRQKNILNTKSIARTTVQILKATARQKKENNPKRRMLPRH